MCDCVQSVVGESTSDYSSLLDQSIKPMKIIYAAKSAIALIEAFMERYRKFYRMVICIFELHFSLSTCSQHGITITYSLQGEQDDSPTRCSTVYCDLDESVGTTIFNVEQHVRGLMNDIDDYLGDEYGVLPSTRVRDVYAHL